MTDGGDFVLSLRLSKELERKVQTYSQRAQISKSDFVREAIEQYIANQEATLEPSLLGEDLWGNHGSGEGDLSITYKMRLKEKLHEKMPH